MIVRFSSRVAFGAAMLVGSTLVVRLIGVAGLAILARLLAPADYGIMALALVALGLSQILFDFQVGNALIREREVDADHLRTAFTLSTLRGALLAALFVLGAPPFAAAVGEPKLEPVLRWLALAPLLQGFVNPRLPLFAKALDFRKEAIVNIAGRSAFLMVAVATALARPDHWALVAGHVAAAVTSTAASYVFAPALPGFGLARWRMFVSFGGWMTGASILSYLGEKLDAVFINAKLGVAATGVYNIGLQTASNFTNQLATPLTRAMFSGLSNLAGEPARLTRAYVVAQSSVLGTLLPIGVGAALAAREILLILAGPKWLDAEIVIQFTGPAMAMSTLVSGVHALAMVQGTTRVVFERELVNTAVRLPSLAAGIYFYDLIGFLIARTFAVSLIIVLSLRIAARATGLGIAALVIASWRSFAACAVMVACVSAVGALLDRTETSFVAAAADLAALGAAGASSYIVAHLALWRAAGRPDGFEARAYAAAAAAVSRVAPGLSKTSGRWV